MEIQAGKRYVRRDDKVSGIIIDRKWPIFPFQDLETELTYTSQGNLLMSKVETCFDLVTEYVEFN